jgi:Protein of unknown function (DUF2971).
MIEKKERLYYKFRSANKNQFLEDIFINQRLFASERKLLNDPMEGVYIVSDKKSRNPEFVNFTKAIKNVKDKYRICSFTKNKNLILLWSHYADSYTGIAIGFKLKKASRNQQVKKCSIQR